ELAVRGEQLFVLFLELRDFTRRGARALDEGVDAAEHILASTQLIFDAALRGLLGLARTETLHARDRAVDPADEEIRVGERLRHGVALGRELAEQRALLRHERRGAVGALALLRVRARDDGKKSERGNEKTVAHESPGLNGRATIARPQ